MIKHIVMWSLREEAEGATATENALKMKAMLEGLLGRIEGLRHIEVSTDVFVSVPTTQIVLYSEFATKEDLDFYQKHPLHQECVQFVLKVVAERRVVDYDI